MKNQGLQRDTTRDAILNPDEMDGEVMDIVNEGDEIS